MSTTYYALRYPFTGARISREDDTSVICLTARISAEDDTSVICLTARDDANAEVRCSTQLEGVILLGLANKDANIAHRSGGRVSAPHHLPDSLQLVSEYGDLTTLGEVRRGLAP